ncbi:hypothetical protein [Candidatus Nitrososphaera evergladensis]|uniref:hypothetical protein n=1 Tax=Candidatus Nitrososphaera evergladensis TaxID=1459637 RepID=UPI00130ED42E|nr:hypothetical protein [Candidatus Nitrososphaera evergladensis]
MLSPKEEQFLKDLKKGNIQAYSDGYRKTLKSRILKKRAIMTDQVLLINSVLNALQKL